MNDKEKLELYRLAYKQASDTFVVAPRVPKTSLWGLLNRNTYASRKGKQRLDEGRVKKTIAELLGVRKDQVQMQTRFSEDLGADSLDMVELAMTFEEDSGVAIPLEEMTTVGQVVNYVNKTASQEPARLPCPGVGLQRSEFSEAVELYRHAYKKASDKEWETSQKALATPKEARKRRPTYKNQQLSRYIDKTVATAKPGYLKQMLREGGRIRQGEAKADQPIKDGLKASNSIISGNFKKLVTNPVVNVAEPSGQGR